MGIDGVFVIEDAHADPRFAESAGRTAASPRIRFYASAPLYAPGGKMVGRLCVIDSDPKSLTHCSGDRWKRLPSASPS